MASISCVVDEWFLSFPVPAIPYCATEIKLLLLLSRSDFDAAQTSQVAHLLTHSLDWPYFLEITQRNKLVPLVFENLSRQFSDWTDATNYGPLKHQLERYIHRNLLLTQSMIQLVNHFKERNIHLVPFKGPVLSHIAYKKPFHRYFEDLDFIVHYRDFEAVCQELLRIGLVANFLNDPTYYRQAQFAAKQTRMVLDVHYALTPVDCFVQVDTGQLLSQGQTVWINRCHLETLSLEDSLIVLCVDAAKGYWRSAIRLVDISEYVRNNAIDWDALIKRSEQLNCQKLLELALFLVWHLFDAPIPIELRKGIATRMKICPSENMLHRQIFKLSGRWQDAVQWHWFNMQTLDTSMATVQYLYRLSKFSIRGIPYLENKIKT